MPDLAAKFEFIVDVVEEFNDEVGAVFEGAEAETDG